MKHKRIKLISILLSITFSWPPILYGHTSSCTLGLRGCLRPLAAEEKTDKLSPDTRPPRLAKEGRNAFWNIPLPMEILREIKDPSRATLDNLKIVLEVLKDPNSKGRSSALKTIPYFIQANPRLIAFPELAESIEPILKKEYPHLDEKLLTKTYLTYLAIDQSGLTVGSQQFLKMWIYSQYKDSVDVSIEEVVERTEKKIVPSLNILELLSEGMPNMGCEIAEKMTADTEAILKKKELSNFCMKVVVSHEVRRPDIAKGVLVIRMLPATYPIVYLLLLMHLRLGLIGENSDYPMTIQGALNNEAFFILCLGFFSYSPLPGVVDPHKQFADSIWLGNAYQSYIGQTVDTKTGQILQETQTYLYDKTFRWIRPYFDALKENKLEVLLPNGEPLTEEYVMARSLQYDVEQKAFLAKAAQSYLNPKEARTPEDEELANAYEDLKKNLAILFINAGFSPDDIEVILGNKDTFFYFPPARTTPYRLSEDTVRPILVKLHQHFLSNRVNLDTFRAKVKDGIEAIKKTYFKHHPLSEDAFDKALIGPEALEDVHNNQGYFINVLFDENTEPAGQIEATRVLGGIGDNVSIRALSELKKRDSSLLLIQARDSAIGRIEKRIGQVSPKLDLKISPIEEQI